MEGFSMMGHEGDYVPSASTLPSSISLTKKQLFLSLQLNIVLGTESSLPFVPIASVLVAEHPELYKDRSSQDEGGGGSRQHEATTDAGAAAQRQAATDQFMLERFRKRERLRVMRR